jgi:hypothetical protein
LLPSYLANHDQDIINHGGDTTYNLGLDNPAGSIIALGVLAETIDIYQADYNSMKVTLADIGRRIAGLRNAYQIAEQAVGKDKRKRLASGSVGSATKRARRA